MKHEIKKYLFDVLTAINSIKEYIGEDRDFNSYQNDKLLRRAIEREIEIIGEAVNRILSKDPKFKIEYSRQIIDTRNWVIHGYDKVDDVIIWGIVTNYIPRLESEILELLKYE